MKDYTKALKEAYDKGYAEREKEILDYVKTDRFISRWNEAKGERFGDFLARVIKEDC